MDAFSNFEKRINSPVWRRERAPTLNYLCGKPNCYSTCRVDDSIIFASVLILSQVMVDKGMKKKWEVAKDEKEKTEVLVAESKRKLDSLSSTVEADMDALVRLADEYGRLSLSGSFSGPLEKEIRLLELHWHSLEEQGVSGDQLEKMRAGLEDRKRGLDVFNKAKEKRIITKAQEVLGAKIVWISAPDIPRQCSPVSHGRFSGI